MPLTKDEREAFLSEIQVGALGVATGPETLVVPIWYFYAPGEDLWILTGTHSRKGKLIAEAGRFSMMVDRLEPTVRYVSVEGPVVSATEGTANDLRFMVTRYMPPEQIEDFIRLAETHHGPQTRFHMRPEKWFSADLGA